MKKIQLFFAAAAFIAVTSAFATKAKTTDEYVLIGDRYELVSIQPPGGHCDFQENSNCKYEKIANDGDDPFEVPGNFSPIDSDKIWLR